MAKGGSSSSSLVLMVIIALAGYAHYNQGIGVAPEEDTEVNAAAEQSLPWEELFSEESRQVEKPAEEEQVQPPAEPSVEVSPTVDVDHVDVNRAYQQLSELETKGKAGKGGYDRAQFRDRWEDINGLPWDTGGCDTRNNELVAHSESVVMEDLCVVESGILHDVYTGETIAYERGDGQVDLDHIVPIANAWQTGAQQWDEEKRHQLAHDPHNLIPTASSVNRQKGDADVATWLIPKKENRCWYVAQHIEIKHSYGLWVTKAEREAMERQLSRC